MWTNIWNIIKLIWTHGRKALEILAMVKPIMEAIGPEGREVLKRIFNLIYAAIKGETVPPITAEEESTERGRLLKRLFNRLGIQFACASDSDYAEFVAWKTLRKQEGGSDA